MTVFSRLWRRAANGQRGCLFFGLFLLLLMAGCAAPAKKSGGLPPETPVTPPAAQEQPEKPSQPGPAASIFAEAEGALAAGRAGEAEILLERALRLEPRNPLYWHTLAQAKFNQRQYRETLQLCRKAESLLGRSQGPLATRNRALQAQAKIAGKSPQPTPTPP